MYVATSYEHRGLAEAVQRGAFVTFLTIGSGAAGCILAGFIADRVGLARVARLAMMGSGGCAVTAGFLFDAPLEALYPFLLVWGIAVVADSGQFSALVTHYSPREHVGTALTVQTCVGFLLTMVTIRLVPVAASVIGWQWAFLVLAPGPFLGAYAMWALERDSGTT